MSAIAILGPYQLLSAVQMSNNITSPVTAFKSQRDMSYDLGWSGTPTGNFFVDGSNSYVANGVGVAQTVQTPGNWQALSLIAGFTASGSAGNHLVNIPYLGFMFMRLRYVATGAGAETIATVADVSSSLASTWFTICDGAGTVFAIWFKVGGTGTSTAAAAANPTATLVEQDISANATASTIGTALASTIAALNSTNSFTTSGTTTVTVTNKVGGPFQQASAGTTGFTVTNTAGGGLLTATLGGKGGN